VTATRNVTAADGKPAPVVGWDPSWTPYWEAWPINAGQSVTTYAEENNDVEDDTYGSVSEADNSKGSLTIAGRAEFYEGATLPADMKPTNTAPAWILPFTRKNPNVAGGTGAIDHNLTVTWDCTGADKSSTITTT
jgi:hypothetical protein